MDPLTKAQIEALEARLRALAQELATSLAASDEESRPVDLEQSIGRLSRVDAMQQQSMVAANRRAALTRRRQVEAALARIAEGEYGACQSCGEEIGLPRLEAAPEAPFCIACQGRREGRG
jgi:DnaK suppressor protein